MVSAVNRVIREKMEAKAAYKLRGGELKSAAVKKGESPLCIIKNSFMV